MRTALILLALTQPACAPIIQGLANSIHANKTTEAMESWVGHDIHETISAWGPPSQEYRNGETTIYVWQSSGDTTLTANQDFGGNTYYTANTSACSKSLTADNGTGKVVSWSWRGKC